MIALCCVPRPCSASALSSCVSERPPRTEPPTVRKSRRLRPSQKPPFFRGLLKIVSMEGTLVQVGQKRKEAWRGGERLRQVRSFLPYRHPALKRPHAISEPFEAQGR